MQPPTTPQQMAQLIDFTYLKPNGTPAEMEAHCEIALRYGFWMVAIHPAEVERCLRLLHGSLVRVGAAVGFPLGQNTPAVKRYEAQDAIQRGAHEIDMVVNIRALLAGDLQVVREEIRSLAQVCHPVGVTSKVILETCYLEDEHKRLACQIAQQEGLDFVKTSTGFGPSGATVEDIRLMRAVVGETMGVKASGGVRSLADALAMIAAGASRLGTSSGVSIVEAMREV